MGFFDILKETIGENIADELTDMTFRKVSTFSLKGQNKAAEEATQAAYAQAAAAQAAAAQMAAAQAAAAGMTPANDGRMYDPQLEQLIDMAVADGELTEKERQILYKRAEAFGIDRDEFDMVLEARLFKAGQKLQPQPAMQQPSQATPPPPPRSDKHGDVRKCPACGAVVESFTTRCPTCGHEFSNIAANSSIQQLFDMLNNVEKESKGNVWSELGFGGDKDGRRRKSIIQNFPIPTTKEDILEFLALAVPLARKPGFWSDDEMAKEMYPTWKAKCEQIIMKAKFSLKDDTETLAMIKEYADELKIKM